MKAQPKRESKIDIRAFRVALARLPHYDLRRLSYRIALERSVDEDDKPPSLRVVSENPNARADRQIAWASEEAQRTLSQLAAAMRRLSDFAKANNELRTLSGREA